MDNADGSWTSEEDTTEEEGQNDEFDGERNEIEEEDVDNQVLKFFTVH